MKRYIDFRRCLVLSLLAISFVFPAFASIFGTVRGIVHDVQHRPISGAHLQLHAKSSDWKREALSDDDGAKRQRLTTECLRAIRAEVSPRPREQLPNRSRMLVLGVVDVTRGVRASGPARQGSTP